MATLYTSSSSPLNTHCDRGRGRRGPDGRTDGRAEQTKWPFLLPRPKRRKSYVRCSPLSSSRDSRGERGGMEWYCCKWPLPLLFCCTMTILLLSSPSQPREPANARPSELSLFISLSTELGKLFLRAKIPFRFSLPRSMRVHLPRGTTRLSGGKHRETRKLSFRNDLFHRHSTLKSTVEVGPRI